MTRALCILALLLAPRALLAQRIWAPVPARPPDFEPAWFAHDSSYIEPPCTGCCGRTLKRVLVLIFREHTPVALRRAAIARLRARVIGGATLFDGDGYYYLYIRGATTAETLAALSAQAERLAGVEAAAPATTLCPG